MPSTMHRMLLSRQTLAMPWASLTAQVLVSEWTKISDLMPGCSWIFAATLSAL